MSSMIQTGEPIGRRDIAIAAVLSVLGLLLIYSDAVEPKIDASYLAIPAFLAVTVPLVWRRSAPLLALGAALIALVAHVAAVRRNDALRSRVPVDLDYWCSQRPRVCSEVLRWPVSCSASAASP